MRESGADSRFGEEITIPHIIVKLVTGRTKEQKECLAEALAQSLVSVLCC